VKSLTVRQWTRRGRLPTDFELLKAIHERHRDDHGLGQLTSSGQKAEVLIPIDIPAIASTLRIDAASVFGRLYYHLDREYGEPAEEGKPRKAFFTLVAGKETNCVNFPVLEAVLAGLWQERRRELWVTTTAVVSIGISIAALIVSIAR
jgi:hypothetical protein